MSKLLGTENSSVQRQVAVGPVSELPVRPNKVCTRDLFVAALSHEIRTPLTAIMGWASLLRRNDCSIDDVREGLDIIERSCRAQLQLVEDLLDISRIAAGKIDMHFDRCDLNWIVSEAVNLLQFNARERSVNIELRQNASLLMLIADHLRLQQVVWNLVGNAIKFSNPGSTVRVETFDDNLGVGLAVIDQGRGIDPHFLPHVFDEFWQGEQRGKERPSGLGLGLSIVRHIVQMHGGFVTAESAGIEKGARFTVKLPWTSFNIGESPMSQKQNT